MALEFVRRRWRWIRFPRWDIWHNGVKVGRIRYFDRDAPQPGYRVTIGNQHYPCHATFGQAKSLAEGIAASGRQGRRAPARPVVPPWCRPGPLWERANMLLEALTAAGWAGLHKYADIYPLDLSEAAIDRGIAAVVQLTFPEGYAPAVEIDERVYLRRFAPASP
jgi:hypothetical protein